MTLDSVNNYLADSTSNEGVRRRQENKQNIEKARANYKNYDKYGPTPKSIWPLLIAGSISGVAVRDIHAKPTIGSVLHLLYVVLMAGIFGFLSVIELSQFFMFLTKDNEDKLLVNLSKLTVFCGDFFTFVAIVYFLKHNEQLKEFYDFHFKISFDLVEYVNVYQTPYFIYILYGIYGTLALCSSIGIATSFWMTGETNSIYITSQFQNRWDTVKYPGLVFYVIKPLIVMIAWSYVEVTLTILSYYFHYMFQSISNKVESALDKYEETELNNWTEVSEEGKISAIELNQDIPSTSQRKSVSSSDEGVKSNSKDETVEEGSSTESSAPVTIETICHLTLKSMEHHYKLSELIRRLNVIYGPMLLFDLCLYLLMITALLYGTVKGIGLRVPSIDMMLALNNFGFLVRLFITLPVYSKVHKSANEIVLTYTRVMAIAPEVLTQRISLYIQQLKNNPVGISAWEFFIVTLGTLLTFWGSVITYLVVLFKNAAES